MKKMIVSMMALMMLTLTITSCGAGATAADELKGAWHLTSMEVQGEVVPMEQLAEMGMNAEMSFDFKDDKNVDVAGAFGDVAEKETLTYTFAEGVVTITQNGQELTLNLVEGKLNLDVGTGILIFERA